MIGAMVAGKASGRIFIENGRFHGELVIAKSPKSFTVKSLDLIGH